MPNYIRITSRGRHNVRVLLEDGTTRVLPTADFDANWSQVQVAPPFEYDENNYVNPSNPEHRVYIRVLRRARFNTTVSLPNGAVVKIPNQYFSTWTQGVDTSDTPLCGAYTRETTRRPQRVLETNTPTGEPVLRRRRGRPRRDGSTEPRGFQNPVNQADRIYVRVVRNGSVHTSVLLQNGTTIKIPNQYLNTWLRLGTTDYNMWYESYTYPNGRSVEDCTFGVEIEFIADRNLISDFCTAMDALVGSDRFQCPLRYGHSSKVKWSLGIDNSVQSTQPNSGKSGFELASPILKFNEETRNELKNVLKLITSVFQGEVNKTCGTHVHVGNFANRLSLSFQSKVQSFRNLYGDLERTVFDTLVSKSRRGSSNRYCQSCYGTSDSSRYFKMNTKKLDVFGTLENRQHQGTLNINKIWYWMELNGRFMTTYFNNPSRFASDTPHSLVSFFNVINLSQEAREFYFTRTRELND